MLINSCCGLGYGEREDSEDNIKQNTHRNSKQARTAEKSPTVLISINRSIVMVSLRV